jgi:hypothetical protein
MRVPISELIIFVEDEPVIKLFHEIFNSYYHNIEYYRISIEICKNIRNELKIVIFMMIFIFIKKNNIQILKVY